MFLATERLDEQLVEACDELFENCYLDVLLGEFLTERGERYGFVIVDAEFEPHVDCGVHGTPLVLGTKGDPASTGVSYYSTLDGLRYDRQFDLITHIVWSRP